MAFNLKFLRPYKKIIYFSVWADQRFWRILWWLRLGLVKIQLQSQLFRIQICLFIWKMQTLSGGKFEVIYKAFHGYLLQDIIILRIVIMVIYSVCYRVCHHQVVTWAFMLSLESYQNILLTYFWQSYASGKLKLTYTGLFFHMVAYTGHIQVHRIDKL